MIYAPITAKTAPVTVHHALYVKAASVFDRALEYAKSALMNIAKTAQTTRTFAKEVAGMDMS